MRELSHAPSEISDPFNDPALSIRIVVQMNELFAIDAQARDEDLSQSDRHVLRLEKSQPLLRED